MRGPQNAQWFKNLVANPSVVLERPGADGRIERIETTAVVTEGVDRARIAEQVRQLGSQLDDFEAEAGRPMPIVVLGC
ncbi:nitroreductase/quinone reductase family protein [Nocardia colli]|uniref:nitroreductase/quinone reductase family protein n=1 Tax=Nocardia colli TaxID=2545717 RepID=UPI00168CCF33|nr:nitroreductase/quinone reductase family protein [Nocardia colli]